jgi:AcrR family transcriptional regulator
LNKERQPAPWLPAGTIHAVGRVAARTGSHPSSQSSRRLPWAERRSQLLEACLEAFVARGLEMTTMDTIAAQAGVSKPLVYRHFHNRSEALFAVVTQESDRILAQLGLAGAPPAAPDFDALVAGFLAFAAERPKAYRLLFQLVDASSGPPRRRLDSLRAALSEGLSQAVLARAEPLSEIAPAISSSRVGRLILSILEGVGGGLPSGEDPAAAALTLSRLLRPDRVVAALLPAAAPADDPGLFVPAPR